MDVNLKTNVYRGFPIGNLTQGVLQPVSRIVLLTRRLEWLSRRYPTTVGAGDAELIKLADRLTAEPALVLLSTFQDVEMRLRIALDQIAGHFGLGFGPLWGNLADLGFWFPEMIERRENGRRYEENRSAVGEQARG